MIKLIGIGEFGSIYSGIYGKRAINFLIKRQDGEIRNAFFHNIIGGIDLVWGKSGERGFGLAKIVEKHPEAINELTESVENGLIVDTLPARVILVDSHNNQRTIVDLQFNQKAKVWLLTSYIPIK